MVTNGVTNGILQDKQVDGRRKKYKKTSNLKRFGFRIEIFDFRDDALEGFCSPVLMDIVVLPGEAVFG